MARGPDENELRARIAANAETRRAGDVRAAANDMNHIRRNALAFIAQRDGASAQLVGDFIGRPASLVVETLGYLVFRGLVACGPDGLWRATKQRAAA
jgi:hypothetical protein